MRIALTSKSYIVTRYFKVIRIRFRPHFPALEVDCFRPRSEGGIERNLGRRVNCFESVRFISSPAFSVTTLDFSQRLGVL